MLRATVVMVAGELAVQAIEKRAWDDGFRAAQAAQSLGEGL